MYDLNEMRKRKEEGRIYFPNDPDMIGMQQEHLKKMYQYNKNEFSSPEEREQCLKELFAEAGEGCYIEAPFFANWGGSNVHLGKNVYMNFNVTLVDDGEIYIGDHVMIGPNVTIATAGHPIDPDLRRKAMQFNKEVHIGDNVWIGAGSVIVPGVSIGENSVIGAGSVVTKDIPKDVIAVGNPCRVLRKIGERDKKYFYKDEEIDLEIVED